MKISITLALVLLITAFLILPTLILVVFFRLPNTKIVQDRSLDFQKELSMQQNYAEKVQSTNLKNEDLTTKSKKNQKLLRTVAYICFVLYLIFLFTLVFGQFYVGEGYVMVELVKDSTWFSLSFATAHINKINLLYNLAMMFPVSAFVFATQRVESNFKSSKYYLKVFLKTILISFLISLFIETFQFVLPVTRTTELFDLVTNTLSGALGFCYFCPVVLTCNKLRHLAPRLKQQ